ncbi:MAG: ribosome small subunit-dependent GTPase A [Ruminococcus albus]|nr:ribosome small subunit-dependent GTPase A [Ruminococcus albus]
MTGIITKAIGGFYTVDASDGIYECNARGVFRKKKISPMCGDRVNFTAAGEGFVIEEILPRSSELIRPPLANLDLLVFVSSTVEPRPNTLLLDKFIAIAEFKGIRPVVVFTKVDKQSGAELAEIYRSAGIDVFECDNVTGEGSAEVKAMLQGKLSAFTGNTGVGKSSLLNNMFPELELATGEISKKLGRGRHTTRHVQLYKLEGGGYIADTPGFSSFDTNRYDIIFKDKLAGCFVEFADYTDKCRFPDCSHTKEKGCAVIEAVKAGEIPQSRFDSYVQMYEEAKQLKEWEYKND